MKDYEYELDKSTGEVVKRYVDMINNDGFKKVKALDYSPEFTYWYERIYLQSPSMCKLEYDDEKLWEAWKAGYKLAAKNKSKEPKYLYLYEDIGGINITSDKNYATKDMEYVGKIKLEVKND